MTSSPSPPLPAVAADSIARDAAAGVYHGNENAVAKIWGRIWSLFDMNGEAAEFLPVGDDRVVVLGRYVGQARDGGSAVYAAFAHVFTVRGDRVAALQQITDSAQWRQFRTREGH